MPKRNKNKNKSRKRNNKMIPKSDLMSGIMVLKPFHPTPIYRKIWRYKITSAIVGQTVTQANIFACWGLAVSNIAIRSLMSNMRIRRVRAIASGVSATTSDELYIRDANQQGLVDPVDSSSTGQGNTVAQWIPNSKSLSSDWFNFGTGGNLFILSVPNGAVLEIDADFVISGAAGTTATASYAATVTLGQVYSMGIDASAGSIYYAAIGMNQA